MPIRYRLRPALRAKARLSIEQAHLPHRRAPGSASARDTIRSAIAWVTRFGSRAREQVRELRAASRDHEEAPAEDSREDRVAGFVHAERAREAREPFGGRRPHAARPRDERRRDLGWTHDCDVDAARCELAAERLGEREHAGLRGAVGGVAVARRDRRHRGHEHELASRPEQRERRGRHVARAEEVHAQHPLEILLREVDERPRTRDAGAIEDEVGRADLLGGPAKGLRDRCGVGDVGEMPGHAAFGIRARGLDAAQRVVVEPEIEERHVRAARREQLGEPQSDSAPAARHVEAPLVDSHGTSSRSGCRPRAHDPAARAHDDGSTCRCADRARIRGAMSLMRFGPCAPRSAR